MTDAEMICVEAGSEIYLGEPTTFPIELVKALVEYYKKQPNVQRAYLAQCFVPTQDDKPGLLISLALKNQDTEIIETSGEIAKKHLPADSRLDVVLSGSESFDSYFQSKNPFYSQSWLKTLGYY